MRLLEAACFGLRPLPSALTNVIPPAASSWPCDFFALHALAGAVRGSRRLRLGGKRGTCLVIS